MLKARPRHEIPKNELPDIFYVGLTDERTPDDAKELMGKIAKNYED